MFCERAPGAARLAAAFARGPRLGDRGSRRRRRHRGERQLELSTPHCSVGGERRKEKCAFHPARELAAENVSANDEVATLQRAHLQLAHRLVTYAVA